MSAHLASDADFEEAFTGSTVVRAHQHAAGAKKKAVAKRSDGPGVAWAPRSVPWPKGQDHRQDSTWPVEKRETAPKRYRRYNICGPASADKAYDSGLIPAYLGAENIRAAIPPRANRLVRRAHDKHLYKNRDPVERFFCRIKQFRRIATRCGKLAQRFASFVALAAAFIWLA
ncbi:MAG: transposase [Betaproteobacteria bacterium]|nr:transposase [Betaproteobacteria bacterium]